MTNVSRAIYISKHREFYDALAVMEIGDVLKWTRTNTNSVQKSGSQYCREYLDGMYRFHTYGSYVFILRIG